MVPEHENTHFEGIVLGGGGTKGILTLGALHYYYEKGTYDNNYVNIYSGTSVGTVISLLLLCGYSPMTIFMEVYKTHALFSISKTINIFDITKNMGVLPIESFSNKVKELVLQKLGFIPTLLELYTLTHKTLILTASNVSKLQTEYYKYNTHPDMSALLAMELSCCLPLVFHSMKYNDDIISDGALVDNFPIVHVDDGKRKVLAIVIYQTGEKTIDSQENEFMNYIYKIISLPIKINNQLRMKTCGENVTLIKIKHNVDMLEFNMSEDKKIDMFAIGYQTAEYIDNTEYLYVNGM